MQAYLSNSRFLEKVIENTYLSMAWVSAFTCLVRTDYNFAFGLFGYYYWLTIINRSQVVTMLLTTNAALILFDLIWMFTAASHWGEQVPNAPVWNSTSGIRSFALFLSSINIIIKFLGVGCLYLLTRIYQKNPDHDNMALAPNDYLGGGGYGSSSYNPGAAYGGNPSYNPGAANMGGNPSYNPAIGGGNPSYNPGNPSYSPNQSYVPGFQNPSPNRPF